MFELYLPRRVLDLAGRRLDHQRLFASSSRAVLWRVTRHGGAPEDWLQFYAIVITAWLWIVLASIAVSVLGSLLVKLIAGSHDWWEPVMIGLVSVTPGVLSFMFVLQAHARCVDRTGGGRIVNYLRYPKPVNLLIIPMFWLISFAVIMLSI